MARWPRTSLSSGPRGARLAVLVGLLAAGAALAEADPPTPQLEFRFHSKTISTLPLDTLLAIAPAQTVRVFEPYEGRELAFRALPFEELLDVVLGNGWREEEELLFTCRDGYQPSVPVRRVLEHRAWLAFAREGSDDFAIEKLESGRRQRVSLGPFYLVWENLADEALRREGDYGWPYQLVGVDVIRVADRFPRLAPPEEAGPEVVRGLREFRIHCSRCHALNGEGGAIGPELNDRASPAGRRDPAWLRRWIAAPAEIAPGARMEPLNPALPERDAVIAAIVAYLQAMAETTVAPADPPTSSDAAADGG